MKLKRTSLFVLVLALSTLSCNAQKKNNQRPNVIFILADDLGAGDLHVTGHPYAKSPNLDKLAKNGIRFEHAYMAAGWCSPSRYGLMSGQYPARRFNDTKNLDPKEPSVTSVLKAAGYTTAHFGKWHITKGTDYAQTPNDFGIDHYFMNNWGGQKIDQMWTEDQKSEEFWRAKTTDAYVDMAIDFMEKNSAEKDVKPFFMNLWIYPTHSYIHPTPEQLAVYDDLKVNYDDFSEQQQEFLNFVSQHGDIDQAMQAYCADITAMDKALGRLFDYLQKQGLDKNTIIVFTSDNGPGPLTTQIKKETVVKRYKEIPDLINSVGYAKHYKDRKLSQNEGGIRVPFIVHWPGQFAEGIVDNTSNIQGVDILPTMAAICQADLPVGQFDGLDITAAFKGKSIKRQEPLFWHEKEQSTILIDHWKGYTDGGSFQLYDLKQDPSQTTDLSNSKPKIASRMEAQLNEWLAIISKN
ncbi:MAG: sulfatase-like hydrolase/transferase [Reichenbachiella sp.]